MDYLNTKTSSLFNKYLEELSKKYALEQTTELSYRTQFENFLKELFEEIHVSQIGHEEKAVGGNKPDFILSKSGIPILFLEVKDIGVSLDKVEKSEQLSRYYGYDNLVLTDYLEFRFYRNGFQYVEPISIATYDEKTRTITPIPENFGLLKKTLLDFPLSHKEAIKSGSHLAKIMGGKAYRIRENAKDMLDETGKEKRSIYKVYETMKRQLIHDMTTDDFADMYAQTLVYGLFVARFHDTSPETFTRAEARDLVPKSNPLLKDFFDHIAGTDFDKRLQFIVDELCEVFAHSDIQKLVTNYYGTEKDSKDPIIHFYEDFLQEYDSKKRKDFGAYYTPLPVVQFIVKAVDHILEHDFKLAGGLANTEKNEKGHIVQVLDPATGTGTFLTEVVKQIRERRKNQSGNWPKYVLHDVLPRLYGFEIMMAPYTIAHLKMSMLLKEMGFIHFNNRRFGIYLTNSLEEGNTIGDMFSTFGLAESISQESKEASEIKKEKPIMVVLGNPPYSVSSSNKGDWITDLIKVYKKDLNERNIQPLSDDYIKFIRFSESLVEKNESGIVAMITNNSFIDGTIHRQMRKHLLETFDNIYILNLHGNSRKGEVSPDGSKDENVFDIMQGVSINIFVKNGSEKKELGKVHYIDLYGTRKKKFEFLASNSSNMYKWERLNVQEPYYFFVPKDFDQENKYNEGFYLKSSFIKKSIGIVTGSDKDLIADEREKLQTDYPKFENSVRKISYRPFDYKYTIFNKLILQRSRDEVMKEMINPNISLCVGIFAKNLYPQVSISKNIITKHFVTDQTYIFPLYLYTEDGNKTPNLNLEIVSKIEEIIGKTTPENILNYIYAILHSPTYREKYKEFLKIDFPRIPYPKNKEMFNKLAKLGNQLIQYHLLEEPNIDPYKISYLGEGENIVEKVEYKDGKVYINSTQYFGNVSEIAWNFYIGGYQPAQKWLKDRKGRELSTDDIEHYSKIVLVLEKTDSLMKEIDKIKFESLKIEKAKSGVEDGT